MDLMVRFLVGGTIVSLFALIGDDANDRAVSQPHLCRYPLPCQPGSSCRNCAGRFWAFSWQSSLLSTTWLRQTEVLARRAVL
jgi:hypothetical protein